MQVFVWLRALSWNEIYTLNVMFNRLLGGCERLISGTRKYSDRLPFFFVFDFRKLYFTWKGKRISRQTELCVRFGGWKKSLLGFYVGASRTNALVMQRVEKSAIFLAVGGTELGASVFFGARSGRFYGAFPENFIASGDAPTATIRTEFKLPQGEWFWYKFCIIWNNVGTYINGIAKAMVRADKAGGIAFRAWRSGIKGGAAGGRKRMWKFTVSHFIMRPDRNISSTRAPEGPSVKRRVNGETRTGARGPEGRPPCRRSAPREILSRFPAEREFKNKLPQFHERTLFRCFLHVVYVYVYF